MFILIRCVRPAAALPIGRRGNAAMTEHKRSWRDFLTVHPAAEKWPLLAEAELRALGEDIKANGLRVPIVLHNAGTRGMFLIDGRNRLDAMELIGVET